MLRTSIIAALLARELGCRGILVGPFYRHKFKPGKLQLPSLD
jgi:hypothetical protein